MTYRAATPVRYVSAISPNTMANTGIVCGPSRIRARAPVASPRLTHTTERE